MIYALSVLVAMSFALALAASAGAVFAVYSSLKTEKKVADGADVDELERSISALKGQIKDVYESFDRFDRRERTRESRREKGSNDDRLQTSGAPTQAERLAALKARM